jgi:hypothetical protein
MAGWPGRGSTNWSPSGARAQATAGERRVIVDLSSVTGIDGAARYLLQLMRVRNVILVGACITIRASLDDDAAPTSELG